MEIVRGSEILLKDNRRIKIISVIVENRSICLIIGEYAGKILFLDDNMQEV